MNIKIATWNIWKSKHVPEITEVLRELQADVIALQEVTEQSIDGKTVNAAKEIADALGYEIYFGKAFHTDRHTPDYDFGNAILSKYPIEHYETHMLSTMETYAKNSTTEPRNATEIRLHLNDIDLRIFSTHLGYSDVLGEGSLQITQVKKLLEIASDAKTLVLGDFNSTPNSTVITLMEEKMKNLNPDRTTPTWTDMRTDDRATYHIDYLFASHDITAANVSIQRYDASDHALLVADIQL